MPHKELYLLLLVLIWSEPIIEVNAVDRWGWGSNAKQCTKPKGSPGDLAICATDGKWKRDWTRWRIIDTVTKNGKKLDRLLRDEYEECAMVVFGDFYKPPFPEDAFIPYHVVTNEEDYLCSFGLWTNYWLTDVGKTGDEASLYMGFKCPRKIKGFKLKNTHNAEANNRGTQNFTISISDGPRTTVKPSTTARPSGKGERAIHMTGESSSGLPSSRLPSSDAGNWTTGTLKQTNFPEYWIDGSRTDGSWIPLSYGTDEPGNKAPWTEWDWTEVLTGTLPDANNVAWVPVQNYKLEEAVETYFVRFQVDSYYGLGGGLQYLSTY